jgi:hypothetical protein
MPRSDYKTCRECERHTDACGPLSHTRLCSECAQRLLAENIVGLSEHKGQPLQRWRLGMVRCAGGVLMDELRELV